MSRTLEKHFFAGDSSKGPETELHHCEVSNLRDDVDAALKRHHKWDGSCIGLIGLWTSSDNLRVHGGSFFTRGKITDGEHRFNCSDIWPEAHVNTTLTINVATCNNFTFNAGGLHSNFLASSDVTFTCHELRSGAAPAHILPANFSKFNIGDFCIRMICHLSRSSSGKRGVILRYTIALYPGKGADLTRVVNEQGPSWPGIKITTGKFPLGPTPKNKWGCPILPFIIPGTPFSTLPRGPSGDKLKRAIDNIMSSAGAAETVKNVAALQEKWANLRANPEANVAKPPSITWPAPAAEPTNTGRKHRSFP